MPDNNEAGIWAAVSSGVMVGIGVLGTLWHQFNDTKRERKAADAATQASDLVRANLDKKQEDIMDRLESENRELRALLREETACKALWEARARRVDTIAHDLRHEFANALAMRGGVPQIPRIPLLEDPLDDDAGNVKTGE